MPWRGTVAGMVMVGFLAGGCRAPETTGTGDYLVPNRTMKAVRAEQPPNLDGKLDDACWKRVEPLSGFVKLKTGRPADYDSFAYLCYDDSYLYVGMKCPMPTGSKPKGQTRSHDSGSIFRDDIVEIMIDPGRSQDKYYQLVMNAYGATFDCSRAGAGQIEDDTWNGEWHGKAHLAEGYWSAELAVPYHNLGITPRTSSTWGMNFCRESPTTNELTSLGADAMFNNARTFVIVMSGVNADFSKYFFSIGPEIVDVDASSDTLRARLLIPVTNRTGRTREVKIDRLFTDADGKEAVQSQTISLRANRTLQLECEEVVLEPMKPRDRDVFSVRPLGETRKVVVSDPKENTVLALSLIRRPAAYRAMRLEVVNPWQKKANRSKTRRVVVRVETNLPKTALKKGTLTVSLTSRSTGKVFAAKALSRPSPEEVVKFSTRSIPWGAYDVRVTFKSATGKKVLSASARTVVLPGGKYAVKPLNNLVSEVMDAKARGLLGDKKIAFMNPRDGWIYLRITGAMGAAGRVTASLHQPGEEPEPLALETRSPNECEAMHFLPAGRHSLSVDAGGAGEIDNVIIRAIPEIVYSRYGANPHTAPFGPFGGRFEQKYIHPNINVLVSGGHVLDADPFAKEWVRRGKKWLLHCGVPKEKTAGKLVGVNVGQADAQGDTTPLTPEDAAGFVSETAGFQHPLAKGSIADEFGNSALYCAPYAYGVWSLMDDPKFGNKDFYPYANHLYDGAEGRLLMEALANAGSKIAWKRYLKTRPTEELARRFLKEELLDHARQYRERCPGSLESIVVCFGNFSAPNEFLNVNTNVNYRKYLDMMFNIVANDPVFWRTYGIMSYLSAYADAETNRWTAHLFRHYGIEGRTAPATDEPYEMTHLMNGDFEDGLRCWDVDAAEERSMRVVDRPGFGWLQGRYPRTDEGEKALLMIRNAKKPNTLTQEVKDLEPGKLYSLRMISADFEDMAKKRKHAVTIDIDNVELLPEKCFDFVIANCYSHHHGPFDQNNKAWMNYHWRIFRPKDTTARLTIKDWAGEDKPGGPVGKQLICNYVMVQPYFSD